VGEEYFQLLHVASFVCAVYFLQQYARAFAPASPVHVSPSAAFDQFTSGSLRVHDYPAE